MDRYFENKMVEIGIEIDIYRERIGIQRDTQKHIEIQTDIEIKLIHRDPKKYIKKARVENIIQIDKQAIKQKEIDRKIDTEIRKDKGARRC